MPVSLTTEIDDEMADAVDRMVADMQVRFPRELAISAVLRHWLIGAGEFLGAAVLGDSPRGDGPFCIQRSRYT